MPDTPSHDLPFHRPEAFLEGQAMVIDKPLTWTSFDVVNKVRYALRGFTGAKKIKVGHAGTLDPLATGVLVVCCGRATKTIDTLQAQAKVYTATVRLGAHTPSLDAETEVDVWAEHPSAVTSLTEEAVAKAAASLTGTLEQRPPLYSAKKVDGVKAYDAARKGADIKLRTSTVTVDVFRVDRAVAQEVDGHPVFDVDVTIHCSKGTYIRSLARDLGDTLGVGGTLTALCRVSSGDFHVDHAWSVDALVAELNRDRTTS
ncbi:MAG: tRNA pseudouridine(55) synthase TruB [Flavobacteriales bacterium]